MRLERQTYPQARRGALRRGRAPLRFADEQVEVFGHDDVSQNYDAVAASYLFEHGQKKIAVWNRRQERLAMETATGDEVEMAGAVIAMKRSGHEAEDRTEPTGSL